MDANETATEVIGDLLRSAWIVESARGRVFSEWIEQDERFDLASSRARQRAEIIASVLSSQGVEPDHDLVEPHSSWIRSLLHGGPRDTQFSDLFLVRLGDWVEAHASPFLGERKSDLQLIAEQERADVTLPSSLPEVPPFEPVEVPEVEAPGETLFRVGILSDLHIGSERAEETARAAIAELNASGAELVIQLGDITDHGNRSEFEIASKLLGQLQMPFATMLGNHDVYSREENRLSGSEYYTPSFGREPEGVILEHKGFRFAVLDSAEYGASPFAPFSLITGSFVEGSGGAIVRGAFSPAQHDVLAEIAASGSDPSFIFLHHPPQPFTSFPPVLFGLRDADSGRLHATCESGNVWGVFAGHTHRNARSRTYGSVPVTEVATARDFPFGYGLVDVSRYGYAYTFRQLSDRDLLEAAYPSAGLFLRRYARGSGEALAFTWERPQ
ncbi:MAG: metallophosphoesterase [Actinomycetota bacterium]|nr:metallophosphoesterase [Actinomycetota bacterium]